MQALPMSKINTTNLARDVEATIQSSFSSQTIDALMYYLFDVELDKESRVLVTETLIGKPLQTQTYAKKNSSLVTSDFCAQYAQYRALGLQQRDAAAMLGITVFRLESLLRGDDITEAQHRMILNAEASADASMKARCLQVIDNAVEGGNWKAAVAMLEKRFPQDYGRKLEVNSHASVKWSSEDCANAATQAKLDLERLRAEREEANGVPQEELYVESQEGEPHV